MGLCFEATRDISVETPTLLSGAYAEYVVWPDGKRLACTQALGHEGLTGFCPDTVVVPLQPDTFYKIVVGTDGVWDMLMQTEVETLVTTLPGPELLDLVRTRWTQSWDTVGGDAIQFQPRECDDMAFIMATIACPATPPLGPA
jgi:serine/threonine protein phosphatase PrpC